MNREGFLMAKTRLPQTLGERLSSLNLAEQLATITTGYTPDPPKELQEPTYYDYPVLQEPLWHWEIYWYFFFGGLAAGCYIIATIASLFASPATPYKRSGKTRKILAYAPYREGEVADVNGNVGSGRLFSILWSLNSNSSGQGWDLGTLVCSKIAGRSSARPPRASRNFRRLLSGKLRGRPAGCHEYPRLVTQPSVRSHFPLFRDVHQYGIDNARVTYLPGPGFCAA